MERKVRNPGQKLLWLPLNSGDYVPIPPGRAVSVDSAQLNGNHAVDKLKQRRLLQTEDVSQPPKTAPVPSPPAVSEPSVPSATNEARSGVETAKETSVKRSK